MIKREVKKLETVDGIQFMQILTSLAKESEFYLESTGVHRIVLNRSKS